MSESTVHSTELTSQYINQVTSDLERNVKEQERITAEIGALQQQLATLQHDHTVLVNMRQALGATAAVESTAVAETASVDGATVPAPRKKATAAGSRAEADTQGKAKKAAPARPAAKRPAKKSPSKSAKSTGSTGSDKAAAPTAQPTLVELIRRHLSEQTEPRSAAEVAAALGRSHPDRGVKANVVRTSLENLVAKNQAQRTKQGTSVFYTATGQAEQTAAPSEAGAKDETEKAGKAE
ncbi:hypothetical protein ACIF8T_22640 [Streptomyces sp. NPDC085946]|uniref:hypothetical protein n=1 Tax=Streptomyces sp. NPDC085946 TaxID=3365744 RepID=UPI0037D4C514